MRVVSRRRMLALTAKTALAGVLTPQHLPAALHERSSGQKGAISGEPIAAKYGEKVLAEGGNAFDAAITTALAACITSPSKCGIGGYGGHAIVYLAKQRKVIALDFNAAAPSRAREDMFALDEKGRVKNNANVHGWLAAAVPGTMAGFDHILSRYGTRSLRQALSPAIELCHEGVNVPEFKGTDDASKNDASPDSVQGGKPRRTRNLPLAKLLETLAARNSAESFYRGDIAKAIAENFRLNGGLVTFEDMAAYQVRELEPYSLEWNGAAIQVVPLTSPGASILQAFSTLKTMRWEKLSPEQQLHAKLEALRIAWADRERFYGDPKSVEVPMTKLLSNEYASESAVRVRKALDARKPVPLQAKSSEDAGTMNISAVDPAGNMIAITFTHGGSYGAKVQVKEYGMVLGHGMWRFEPRPGHPNSPGPRKRMITNMTPAIVTRDGRAVLALGGAGGTRIPNSVAEVLLGYVCGNKSLEAALEAPRLQTTGALNVELEKTHPSSDETFLKSLGYKVTRGTTAYVSAAEYDLRSASCKAGARGKV